MCFRRLFEVAIQFSIKVSFFALYSLKVWIRINDYTADFYAFLYFSEHTRGNEISIEICFIYQTLFVRILVSWSFTKIRRNPQSHSSCFKIVTCIHSNLEDIHERRNYVNNEQFAGQTTTQATNLIGGICEYCTRLGGYKANRMESTRPRGRVCGQGEIRRIKGGFVSLEAGSIRGCNVILANNRSSVRPYRADLPRAGTAITSGAERATRRATTRAVSLEPQWVNGLKTPHPFPHFRSRATKLHGRCIL